jgi:fibronectin-binding autotransporter adhesin
VATRTISVVGGNWNATGAWDEGVVPVAGDAVVARAGGTSGNLTVNVASACASLVLTNYAGTLTFDSTLTTTSTVTLVSGMSIAGTAGTLVCNGGGTLTSGGKTLTCALTLGGAAVTFTLADDWTVNGVVSLNFSSGSVVNGVGRVITCAGGLTVSGVGGVTGTAKLKLTGGTWSHTAVGNVGTALDLAGNVTVSGTVRHDTGALTYVSGTITTAGSTLTMAGSGTVDTSTVAWDGVTVNTSGPSTVTLNSNLVWSGTLTLTNGTTLTLAGAGKPNGTGAVAFTGTSTVTLNNTGGLVTTGTMTLPNAAMTFAGTAGFTVGTLTTATLTASRVHTLTFGNTYTVTAALGNAGATSSVRQALKSSSPGNKVVFTLRVGATLTLSYCDPTDVDSSAGATVVSVGGTITTSLNWAGSVTAGGVPPRFGLRGPLFGGREEAMDIPLDEVIHVEGVASSSLGAAADADSTPTFAVYEEATDTDVGVGGNMTKRTSLTGDYRASFTASAANGFELGKWYSVVGSATVGGVAAKAVLARFRVVAAENTAGYPLTDVSKVNNTAQTAGDLAALLNSLVSATGAGDLTTKTADSATLTTGSTVSGSYTDTATDNDVFWITAPVTPAVGGFGLRQQFVFNLALGRVPVGVYLRGWFNGAGRSADLYALNSRTGVYDKLTNSTTNLASRTTELAYTVTLPRDYADSSGGVNNVVTLELRSTSTTTADRLRVDQLLVTHVAESSPTTLVAPTTADIWSFASRTLTTPGVEPAAAPTTADITAAISAARPDVTLADGVEHGGTPGSSTATIACQQLNVSNGAGLDAVLLHSTAPGGSALHLRKAAAGGWAVNVENVGGGTACAVYGDSGGINIDVDNASTSGAVVIGTDTAGSAILLRPTSGHGIDILASGTGKHGLSVTGGTGGTSDGAKFVAGTGGVALRAATIQGDLGGRVLGNTGTAFAGKGVQADVVSVNGTAFAGPGVPSDRVMLSGVLGDQSLGDVGHVVLPSGPAANGVLAGSRLRITAGSGQYQERTVTTWDGTNKIAGIDTPLAGATQAAGDSFQVLYDNAPQLDGGNVLAVAQVVGLNAGALAQFFTLDSGATYADAVAGSVVKEVVANAVGGGLTAAGVRSAVGLASANLDTQLGGVAAKTANLPASPAAVGSAMTLADGAITDAKFTVPAEAAGPPTGFMARILWLTARLGLRRVRRTPTAVETYLANGTTVATTQAYTTGTTDDVGAAV